MREVVFLFCLGISLSCTKNDSLKAAFPGLNFNPPLQNHKIASDPEFEKMNVAGIKIQFNALKGHLLIAEVLADVDPDSAIRLMKNKKQIIEGMVAGSLALDTEGQGCPSLAVPKVIDNKIQTAMEFNLEATEKLVIGACSDGHNLFHAQELLLYCKNDKKFYDIRYFYPKNIPGLKVPIAGCSK